VALIVVIVTIVLVVAGLGRRLMLGGRWRSRTRLAFVLFFVPLPVGLAFGSVVVGWGMTWSAAAFIVVPVVGILRTLGIGRRRRGIGRASMRQATAFVIPPEISTFALVGHDERNEREENENMLKKHGYSISHDDL